MGGETRDVIAYRTAVAAAQRVEARDPVCVLKRALEPAGGPHRGTKRAGRDGAASRRMLRVTTTAVGCMRDGRGIKIYVSIARPAECALPPGCPVRPPPNEKAAPGRGLV